MLIKTQKHARQILGEHSSHELNILVLIQSTNTGCVLIIQSKTCESTVNR